jgi:separase
MESNSLLPSLYSLKLYLILETRGCDREDLQITQRLMLLSGILETLGRENDAFFIGCFALKREALKFFSNEICEKDILNFLANQTDGILPLAAQAPALSNEAFSICRRMSNLLISSGIDTFSSQWKTLPNTPTLESFLDSRIELFRHCKELHASPGMMLAIQGIFNCDDLLRDDWRIGCFFLLVEVSSMLGKAIASRSSDQNENPEDIELLLLRYSELITTLHNLIESFHNMRKASFHSLLDLTASASLSSVSGRRWIASTPSWLESCNFRVVEKATKIASDAISNCNLSEDSMLCSCHLATHTLLLAMGVQSIEEAFENSVEAIRSIIEATTNEEETDGPVLAKRWAMWCGSHVLDQIEHRGDKEKVAALSMWLIALPDDETKFSLWFHSSLLSSCADENNRLCVTKSYAKVAANLPTNTAQRGNALWIFETELTLCRIQADILNSNNHLEFSYQEMESDLERIEEEINGSEQPDEGLFLLQHWLLSTLHFVRADLASAFGQFPLALKATQECLRHCQIIMKNRNLLKQESHCMTSELATTSIIERARSRYIQVLIKRPKLHYHLGDHRKADAYVRSLLNFLNFDSYDENPHGSHSNALKELAGLLNNAPEVRLILKIMGWASTPDQATNDLACDSTDFSIHGNQDDSENCVVDSIQNLISGRSYVMLSFLNTLSSFLTSQFSLCFVLVGDILYGDSITSSFKQAFLPFYSEAIKNMAETTRLAKFLSFGLPSQMQDFVGDTLSKHVELRNARLFLETNQSFDGASDMAVQQACLEIDKDELSRSEDKAWALYYLGILELNQARRTGSLQRLWQDFDDSREEDEPCTHLLNAKDYLSRALLHVVNSSDVLIRNILRSLALASGPSVDGGIGMSSGILVLTSIGQSLRRRMTWSFQNSSESSHGLENDERVNFFETFDGPFTESRIRDDKIWKLLQAFGDTVSPHWNFIAPVICPSGEMLITKIAKNEVYDEFVVSTECIFPPEGKTSYDCIVAPLDSILQKMHGQLHHIKPDLSIENTDKDAVKREWWDMRGQLDDEMASLLEEVEAQFFSQAFAQKDFLPRGNLVSKFDEIFDNANILLTSHREERANKLKSLTVPVLKEKLIDAGVQESNLKTLRKMELIDLLIDTEDASNDGSEYSQDDDTCLFLILDENLQRFPFEGMPVLQGKAVCRVPCLTFVLAKLYELGINQNESPELDPANTSFVLDPERNLQGTRKRILPVVEELQSERNWGWNAVIGNMPSTEFFEMGLTKSKSLFMYFGHGGAQLCFSRRRVEELITQRVTMLCEQKGGKACEASVVLMGCSSGRLESINRKNSNLIEETPLYYEPGGVALSYLCAGAPCVVGNLWDVTDHDIDR